MKDERGFLTTSFEEQHRLVMAVLKMPLKVLENVARSLSAEDYKYCRNRYKTGNMSISVYRGFLALIIYDNEYMQKIFKED